MSKYAHLLPYASTHLQREALQALLDHGGEYKAAAALGWDRAKLQSHLRAMQRKEAQDERPVAAGDVHARESNPLPPGTYILTAAQNNTHIHKGFWRNLLAFKKHTGARLMVSRFTYNKASFKQTATKPGRGPTLADEGLWYDPAVRPFLCDDPETHGSCRYRLAKDLLWCAEMNILPTAVNPLSGLETYGAGSSCIFPHATISMESLPVMGGRPPRFNYTTGACTLRNYIAKKEGIKAEFHHHFGALIVEVDEKGDWWVRQLNADNDGTFYDLDLRVKNGKVTSGHRPEAINWGDVHASECDPDVAALNWDKDGVLDTLRPKYQFWHDSFSMRSRSHHEQKSFAKRFEKWVNGGVEDNVREELECTVDLMKRANRPWCKMVVVSSNHDRHLDRWLDEADYRQDPTNAEIFLELQLAKVRSIGGGWADEWDALHWGLRRCGLPGSIKLLGHDQSFVICKPHHPVECGAHGDEGADGARGSTRNLARVAIRINKGHDHKATLYKGVASAGVCARTLPYAHGPSSWSISDILTYENGKRAILTLRGGKKWRDAIPRGKTRKNTKRKAPK